MYPEIAKILPKGMRKKYIVLMGYADVQNPERTIGFMLAMGIVLAAVMAIIIGLIFSLTLGMFLLVIAALYTFFEIIFYAVFTLRADGKGRAVEGVLPDALLLMSMNIRSGMTTDRALIMSALTEFGPLEKELNRAGKQLLAGKEIRDALLDITTRIKSKQLDRTIRLIIEGVESGGELSNLLMQTAEDIQNTKLIQNEVRANVLMYIIFIFFAAGIGAPLLFGVSTYLVGALSTQFSTFQTGQVAGLSAFGGGGVGGPINISPSFLTLFALASLTMTSFFGGLMMGVVKGGSEKEGLKMIPVLLVVSLSVFFIVRTIVAGILVI
jgi:flagellar protein FlaJ